MLSLNESLDWQKLWDQMSQPSKVLFDEKPLLGSTDAVDGYLQIVDVALVPSSALKLSLVPGIRTSFYALLTLWKGLSAVPRQR